LVRFLAYALASKFKAVGLVAVRVVNSKITYDALIANKKGLRLDKVFHGRFGQHIDSVFACTDLVVGRSLSVNYQLFGRLALELL